jgi:hypothetical protein
VPSIHKSHDRSCALQGHQQDSTRVIGHVHRAVAQSGVGMRLETIVLLARTSTYPAIQHPRTFVTEGPVGTCTQAIVRARETRPGTGRDRRDAAPKHSTWPCRALRSERRQRAAAAASQYFLTSTGRCIGKSRSKRPPKQTQRPPDSAGGALAVAEPAVEHMRDRQHGVQPWVTQLRGGYAVSSARQGRVCVAVVVQCLGKHKWNIGEITVHQAGHTDDIGRGWRLPSPTDEVGQLQRTHRHVSAQLHDVVDVFRRADALWRPIDPADVVQRARVTRHTH